MGYQSTVLKVMIATPGDVAQERVTVRDVIHEWNAVHSEDRGIVLMPIGWDTHSTPDMGDRPQAIINKQVLTGCDFLVAVFWTRLGSPTGKAASGTVEEIDEHVAAGRPAMIYFSSEPVRMDSVDEEQYSQLRQFREECRRRGLIETYENRAEFREKFARHLAQTVIRWQASKRSKENSSPPKTASEDADTEDFVRQVLRASKESLPELTEAATTLLLEASSDRDGTVLRVATFGGLHVETNGKDLVTDHQSPREEARWQDAIDQLCGAGLLRDRGHDGEVFGLTERGYQVADTLAKKRLADPR
jgi:hypothetical protein